MTAFATTAAGPARSRFAGQDGMITAFTAVLALALLLCAGLVLDGGLALAAKVRAMDEAQEAARTGAEQLDLATYRSTGTFILAPQRAAVAARSYVASAGDEATVTVTGTTVTVTVTHVYRTQLLGLAGVRLLRLRSTAVAHVVHGIEGEQQ